MKPWHLVVVILAIVCFALAGFGVKHPKVDLIGIGLALFALATLIPG